MARLTSQERTGVLLTAVLLAVIAAAVLLTRRGAQVVEVVRPAVDTVASPVSADTIAQPRPRPRKPRATAPKPAERNHLEEIFNEDTH